MNLDNFITKHIVETTGQSGIDWIKTMYIQNTKKDTDVLEISNRSWEIFHAWRILRAMKKVLMVCDRSQKEKNRLCVEILVTKFKQYKILDPSLLLFFSNLCWKQLSFEKYEKYMYCKSSKRGSRNSTT